MQPRLGRNAIIDPRDLAERRIREQNAGILPSALREAAFERAAVQILDKLQGHSVVGVVLYDC